MTQHRHTFAAKIDRRTMIAGATGALLVSAWPLRAAGVTAVSAPPIINRIEFDARRPPDSMPQLTPPEAAVCDYEFGLESGVDYSFEPFTGSAMTVRIDALSVVTRLEIEIWTPRNANRRIVEHEEGHRQICEHYYANAEAIAEQAATAVLGRRFVGRGATAEDARKDAVGKALAEVETAYMSRMSVPCQAAQLRFDELTEHGTNRLAVDEAIAQAVSEFPATMG